MARYLKVAEEANQQIKKIVETYAHGCTEDVKAQLIKELAHLYNLGIRTAPRAVQSTVRLNAVKEATIGFPVSARMEKKQGFGDKKYNALILDVLQHTKK